MKTVRLRVTLREVSPTVLRVLDVPAVATLPELHHLLQAGMGWTDSHLHKFIAGGITYGEPDDDIFEGDHVHHGCDLAECCDLVNDCDLFEVGVERDQTGVGISELGDRFVYLYDLGDGWNHDVAVLGSGRGWPGCVYGEGECPPEDCGGPGGYARLQRESADPSLPEQTGLGEWAGPVLRKFDSPREFDQSATDVLVRQSVGEVPDSVRLVLELAEGGVRLTPGGRLPRDFVRKVQHRRPEWSRRGHARP